MDPPTGVVNGIQFILRPWFGSGLRSTSRWSGWDFRPFPSFTGGAVLGPSVGGSHGESSGTGVKGIGTSSYSLAASSTRKRVRPWGNVGSSPISPSTSNLTYSLGFSSASVGASSHHALLLDMFGLGCRLRFFME